MPAANNTDLGGPSNPVEVIEIDSSPPQSPISGKRKASDDTHSAPKSGKKAKGSSVVELNGRKLVFHQTAYERPPIPRRRLLELQMDLLDAKEEGKPLDKLPEKFWDLVVLAGHELTSPNELAFIKAIKTELLKGGDGDILPADLLADPIKELFTLKQYGFQGSDFNSRQSRFPAGLQIRCWEANDIEKYFPTDSVKSLLERREERERAREECVRLVAAMDDAEKHELVKGDKAKDDIATPVTKVKQAAVPRSRDITPTAAPTASSSRQASVSPTERGKVAAEDDEESKRKQEEKEAKKAEREEKKKELEEKKAEREAKRAEIEEKKAEKAREEKKKADARDKQRALFGNFFAAKQAKQAAKAGSSSKPEPVAQASPSKAKDDGRSDFEKAFKPPEKRSTVRWMPVNGFDLSVSEDKKAESVAGWTPRDFINDHLSRHNLTTRTPRADIPRGLKTGLPFSSVAEMYAEYQTASDPRLVRRRLLNTDRFPQKILAFDQQARPPYTGTFTKPSVVVGPRTPFEQDPLFDYSYDSGDDWQEDEGGEDVEGGEQDAEADEDVSDDDQEDEFDDWLDNEEDPLFKPDADGDVPMIGLTPPPNASPVRGATKDKKRIPIKRIHKLDQDCQGPFWETEIGQHPSEEWNPYRIQLLNDTPASIDPFKYESSEPLPLYKATFTDTAVGMQVGIKCLLTTEQAAAPKPSAPAAATPASMPLGDASSTANTPGGSRPRVAQKIAFSDSQISELLDKIDNSPKIQSDLVIELRGLFPTITKAAIEAKVREVASREGKGKEARWRVKTEAWKSAGLEPPARGLLGVFIDRAS